MCQKGHLCAPQALLVEKHLKRAIEAADRCHGTFKALASWWHGDDAEETWRNIHQAEALLLQFADDAEFRGRLPRAYVLISRQLGDKPDWARSLAALNNVVRRYGPADTIGFPEKGKRPRVVPDDVRRFVITLLRTAQRTDSDGYTRIREYRNVLWVAFLCTSALAGLLLLAAGRFPQAFPAWLEPSKARGNFRDVGVIMLYGVLGAAVSVLQTLPSLPSFEAPYSLRDPQLLLKVSSGTLTALIGVILLEAELLPWVKSPIDSTGWETGKVAAAAIIFGYVQHFITRFVDKEAESIVSAARPYVDDPPLRTRSDTVRSL